MLREPFHLHVGHKILLGELIDGATSGVHDIVVVYPRRCTLGWTRWLLTHSAMQQLTAMFVHAATSLQRVYRHPLTKGQFSLDLIVKVEGDDGLIASNHEIFRWRTTLSMEMEPEPFRR